MCSAVILSTSAAIMASLHQRFTAMPSLCMARFIRPVSFSRWSVPFAAVLSRPAQHIHLTPPLHHHQTASSRSRIVRQTTTRVVT